LFNMGLTACSETSVINYQDYVEHINMGPSGSETSVRNDYHGLYNPLVWDRQVCSETSVRNEDWLYNINMGPTGCSETSLRNNHYWLYNPLIWERQVVPKRQ
jgi:hypothetical protein